MTSRPISVAALITLCCVFAGCPEERPGVEKLIPTQRIPPALAIEPGGADAGNFALVSPSSLDAGTGPAPTDAGAAKAGAPVDAGTSHP